MKKKHCYLFAALCGLFLVLSFPPMPFNLLAFVAIFVLLYSLESSEKLGIGRFKLMYIAFLVQHLGTLWWVGSWQKNADPFLMIAGVVLCLLHPFFYFVPIECYWRFKKKLGLAKALIMLPFIWTAFEWLTSITEWAFPWLSLGYTQVENTAWNQIADLGGVLLLSFIIVAVNAGLFYLAYNYTLNEKSETKRQFLLRTPNKQLLIGLCLTFILPKIYSGIRCQQFDSDNFSKNPKLTIGIIQPNINPWDKWSRLPMQNIVEHIKVQDSLSKTCRKKIDLSLWSETSITFMGLSVNSYPYNFSMLRPWLDSNNFSLMTGFTEFYFFRPGEQVPASADYLPADSSKRFCHFNSTLLLTPSNISDKVQLYHKMKLTPISERIPYVDQIAFLKNMLQWNVGISNWSIGTEQKNLIAYGKEGKFLLAPIICIESIHQDFVRKFVNQGAEILTVITNDAWYNHTFGPYQHFAIAQMRAIENKRYLARCANGGISGFISPIGEKIDQAEQYQNSGIARSIPKIKELTLYSRIGDVIGYASLACCFVMYFASKSYIKK